MTSYSQFLPQGPLGTSSMPFFMPQAVAPQDKFRYNTNVSGSGRLIDFSPSTPRDIEAALNDPLYYGTMFTSRTSGTVMSKEGAGLLTHIITPTSNATQTVSYDVTVDNEVTYRFTLNLTNGEIGLIGGFQITSGRTYPDYPSAGNSPHVGQMKPADSADIMVYSPQTAPIQGAGIPFTSRIEVTRSSFSSASGESSEQFMGGLYFGQREVL